MSGLFTSYIEDQLDVMGEWDADSLVSALDLTSQEILNVPEFKNKAIQWIQENCP